MRQLFLGLTVFFTVAIVRGQATFQKIYGDSLWQAGYDMQETIDSGFVITGITYSNNYISWALLFKTDKNGNPVWSKKFEINGKNITSYSVRQTSDSGFIFSGIVEDTSGFPMKHRIFLIKTNINGNLIWSKVYQTNIDSLSRGNYPPPTVRQTATGGYIITGAISSQMTIIYRAFLINTDSNGNILWTKTYCKSGNSSGGYDIRVVSGGFVLGGTDYSQNSENILLIKVDSNGIPRMNKILGSFLIDSLAILGYYGHMTVSPDGGYVFSGPLQEQNGWGLVHIYCVKTNSNGNISWSKIYEVIQTDESSGYSIENTSDYGFVLGGVAEDSLDNDDTYLIKADSSGNIMWDRIFGKSSDNGGQGYCAQQTKDNGYSILAQSYDYSIGSIYAIKTDSIGNNPNQCNQLNWTIPFYSKTFWDSAFTIQVDSSIFIDTNLVFVTTMALMDTVNACSTPVSASEIISLKNDLQIFPNPFSTSTTLQANKFLKNATLTVYNSYGEAVKQIINISGQTITLICDNLASGLYFVRLTQDNKIIATKKIVIID